MNAVQKLGPEHQVISTTPMQMLAQAVEKGMAAETIDKLMGLAERWDKTMARKAFDVAISAAKGNIPVIVKTSKGHNEKRYADFATIARAVDPILGEHGLSYRFRTVQDDKGIKVTCVLSHEAGHSEENTLAGPADQTGNKNAIQAIGSTLTYLQRYSLVQALGLAASDDDDGKAGCAGETINEIQIGIIQGLIVQGGADIAKFCKFMKVDRIEDISVAKYDAAVKALEAKKAKP